MNSSTYRRRLGAAASLVAIALVLVACTNDNGGTTSTGTTNAGTTTAGTTTRPAPQPPPAPPQTGVLTLLLGRPTAPPTFVYTADQGRFTPQSAVVTSVTNTAVDRNGDGVDLGPIKHTDGNGVNASTNPSGTLCPQYITLRPGLSTSAFNSTLVAGTWSAEAACISNALLRNSITLRVSWRVP